MDEVTFEQSKKTLTTEWQKEVMGLVLASGIEGITNLELQEVTGKGHGATSGALSRLHASGHIFRLKEKRKKHSVYAAPYAAVAGREIVSPMDHSGSPKDGPCTRPECVAMEQLYIAAAEELRELKGKK